MPHIDAAKTRQMPVYSRLPNLMKKKKRVHLTTPKLNHLNYT